MERYLIRNESDVGLAVLAVQARAKAMGFSADQQSRLGTAISELATNIVKYTQGKGGDIVIREINGSHKDYDLLVQARDNGGGINSIDQALQDHYSSGGSLGLGLPGVKRIVDYFQIASELGVGTLVTIGMKL